ncbi:MAG: HIT family protein [Candidatus Woesebacteria bacterium]|jgi:diadenosine tetraphosphate (Ap4A) HIT family hydrolase
MHKDDCVFCQIAKGEMPCHKVWEDEKHLAFLSIFPNTEGFTVIAPKEHYSSYAFEQENQVLSELIIATKKTAQVLDKFFKDVNRCGMFFEGYGVDHLHSKLFPMHGTVAIDEWQNIESKGFDQYFDQYPGYLCSNNSKRADDKKLAKLAKAIRDSY